MKHRVLLSVSLLGLSLHACVAGAGEPYVVVGRATTKEDLVPPVFPLQTKIERRILRGLNESVSVHADELPLPAVIIGLEEQTGLPFESVDIVLEQVSGGTELKATCHADGLPLRDVLTAILKPHGLSFTVHNDAIVVTTDSRCCELQMQGIYPAGDLLNDGPYAGDELVETLIESTSGPWEDRDGAGGTIRVLHGSRSLLVRTQWRNHNEITLFLTALRVSRRINANKFPPPTVPAPGTEGPVAPAQLQQQQGGGGGFF